MKQGSIFILNEVRSVEVETGGENGIADDRRREENFKRCISFNHPIIYAHMHFIR